MPTAVVVGGGYAGVQSARLLAKKLNKKWFIRLLTRTSDHELITRLPEIASGRIHDELARVPYGRILPSRVQIQPGEISSVRPQELTVESADGSVIDADRLVVTTGSRVDFLRIPGAREHALPLKTVQDAITLKARIAEMQQKLGTVHIAIIGAGYTGTELSGELAARLPLDDRQAGKVTVVAEHNRLMPDGNPHLAYLAERRLRNRGVVFRLGRSVESVERDRVILVGGEYVECDVAIWAARSLAAIPGRVEEWETGHDCRIRVDPYLRALGCEGVYVAGDCALAYDYQRDAPVPSNAQLAVQEGLVAANSLAADCGFGQLREFVPHMRGEAVSLGAGDGVAEVAGVTLTGRLAVAAKRGALVNYLSGFGAARVVRDYA